MVFLKYVELVFGHVGMFVRRECFFFLKETGKVILRTMAYETGILIAVGTAKMIICGTAVRKSQNIRLNLFCGIGCGNNGERNEARASAVLTSDSAMDSEL